MKKQTKSKTRSVSEAAGQDIVGLLTTLIQKLTSFETKIDAVLSRIPPPIMALRQQPMPAPSSPQRMDTRPMHRAVCADCGKTCEVPFRPSGGRPVYCKECFTARKNSGTFKPRGDIRPKERPPVHARPPERSQVAEPAKPVKKKPSAKKKKKT